jgi:hypothetical protein
MRWRLLRVVPVGAHAEGAARDPSSGLVAGCLARLRTVRSPCGLPQSRGSSRPELSDLSRIGPAGTRKAAPRPPFSQSEPPGWRPGPTRPRGRRPGAERKEDHRGRNESNGVPAHRVCPLIRPLNLGSDSWSKIALAGCAKQARDYGPCGPRQRPRGPGKMAGRGKLAAKILRFPPSWAHVGMALPGYSCLSVPPCGQSRPRSERAA